ncbi:hypothetical protein K432DRAFT_226883 [Lepidopterella palustris CBS 459.81]|uniref:Uncharacterized protein n=1 Tax=Lepidopterella palustris CBS 459.81 TaxID=1314670 RepID=A0A8E2JGY5_9PEZI|nr:hypothetical protein K432DRAFT_226883 [Lepidopterella palustris CBS 459.81]
MRWRGCAVGVEFCEMGQVDGVAGSGGWVSERRLERPLSQERLERVKGCPDDVVEDDAVDDAVDDKGRTDKGECKLVFENLKEVGAEIEVVRGYGRPKSASSAVAAPPSPHPRRPPPPPQPSRQKPRSVTTRERRDSIMVDDGAAWDRLTADLANASA